MSRIGIAPGTENSPTRKPTETTARHVPLPGQDSFLDDGLPTLELDPATVPAPVEPHANWAAYSAWRKTKTTPRSGRDGERDDRCEAALGMAGEAAEMAVLFLGHGLETFTDPIVQEQLIEEAGDLLFYATWAIDGVGVAVGSEDPNDLVPEADLADIRSLAAFLVAVGEAENTDVVLAHVSTSSLFLTLQVKAGEACDATKKTLFGGRAAILSGSVIAAMCLVQVLLILAGSSMGEALAGNVAKINARYPNGFRPKKGA